MDAKRLGKSLGISFIIMFGFFGLWCLVNWKPIFIVPILYGYYLYRVYDSIDR